MYDVWLEAIKYDTDQLQLPNQNITEIFRVRYVLRQHIWDRATIAKVSVHKSFALHYTFHLRQLNTR